MKAHSSQQTKDWLADLAVKREIKLTVYNKAKNTKK